MSSPAVYLDPLNQALADELATQPSTATLSVDQYRALLEKLQHHKSNTDATRTSFTVPFEDGVKTFIFRPKGVDGTLPVIFFFHGGGWVAGSVNSHDSICRDLALKTGYAVVFPEYTRAPEAHYPTQQEQCYAVVRWVREHGNSKQLSQDAFGIVGDSAGGQLTGAVTILCSTRKPTIPIRYQVMINPVTDTVLTDRETKSEFRFFNGPLLDVPTLRKDINLYIPDPDDRKSELATLRNISEAHAKKQPPTLIVNSAADPLRDDGILYGEILQRAGVECTIITAHGQLHDSLVLERTRLGATPSALVMLIASQIMEAVRGIAGADTEAAFESEDQKRVTKKRRRHRTSY